MEGRWVLFGTALKPEFDPDLEVNDSTSQNLVAHQKHGDDLVILKVVVGVK